MPEYTRNASFVYETKKTDWVGRNGSNKGKKDLPGQVDILRLWIDHSRTPVDDTYGYVVYAGDGMPMDKLPFQVLRNDTLVQAVENNNGEVVEAVFYKEGTGLKTSRGELSVSAPCAILIDKDKLSVTDATMNPDCKEITVSYGGKRITVAMPQGMLCGKSVTVDL